MKTFYFFLLASLFTVNLVAQETTGKIQGYTLDKDNGDTLTFVNLTLTDAAGKTQNTQSDLFGHYVFSKLVPGTYKIEAEFPGYVKLKHSSLVVAAGKTVSRNFSLAVKEAEIAESTPKDGIHISSDEKRTVNKWDAYSGGSGSTVGNTSYLYSDPEHNTESYSAINENGFRSSTVNPLSTFSVDVDAASYANVRRYILQGTKPVVDAVRVEEMINYFDYDYPDPTDDAPFSITTEIGECPWNTTSKLVHIGLQGQRLKTKDLPANNLVFLIDVSGSMASENKLPLLIKSFELLVNEMRSEDRVAIVVYAGAAGVVLESTSGDKKTAILESLQTLKAGGSTAGGQGIQLAYKVAQDHFIDGGNNRVILATDGDFNVGMSSDADMQRLIEEKRESGVFLTCLGFGMGNYQDSKLEILADKGNGNYAYIDNLLEAKKVLVTEMGGTLLTIAKDVKIQVEFNPLVVESYRLVGYENRLLNEEDFNNDQKDAGEIGAGHSVTALYEVVFKGEGTGPVVDPLRYSTLEPNQSALINEILSVKFRYKKPDGDTSLLIQRNLENKVEPYETLSDDFKFSAAVSAYGMLLRDSEFKGIATFDQVIALAKESKGADKNGYRAEFIRLAELTKTMYENTVVTGN